MLPAPLLALALISSPHSVAATKKPSSSKAVKAPPPPPPKPGPRPSEDARVFTCGLDGLPEARMAWNGHGHLWLIEGPDVLFVGEVGEPLPPVETRIRCGGTHAVVEVVRGGTSLSALSADFDLTEIVGVYAPSRTPEARARRAARDALNAGDAEGARAALAGLDRKDPDTAEMWVWIALEDLAAGRLEPAATALADLPPDTSGRPTALNRLATASMRASREAQRAGQQAEALRALAPAERASQDPASSGLVPADLVEICELGAELRLATGDLEGAATRLHAALALDPSRTRSWLMLADVRWRQKDKSGSRDAYAKVAASTSPGLWPAELRERCPKCGK